MAGKGTFVNNVFENLEDLGKATVKNTARALKDTFNPLDLIGQAAGFEEGKNTDKNPEKFKNKNSTPLDLKKLQEKYQDKDKAKLDAYRNKLFQLVKSGDEKLLDKEKQEKNKKIQQEAYQKEEEKKKKQQQIQSQSQETPHGKDGKERKNIFGKSKKKANTQLERSVEYKQNAGK